MLITRFGNWIKDNSFFISCSITLLAAALRFHDLGVRSLWFDEAIEVIIARAPLHQMGTVSIAWGYGDPPLYSWLLHFILKIGASDVISRLPSALIGILGVALSYPLFRLWVNKPLALFGQILLAVAPGQVYYAQEVNQYAPMVTMSILLFWSFERAVRRTEIWRVLIFGMITVVALWTHYGLIWLFLGLGATIPLRQKPRLWLKWWPALGMIGVTSLALGWWFAWPEFQTILKAGAATPTPPQSISPFTELLQTLSWLLGTARLFSDYTGGWTGRTTIITWIFIFLFIIGLAVSLKESNRRWAILLLLMPTILSYVAFKLGLYAWTIWGMRYLLFLSPLCYLMVCCGLERVQQFFKGAWLIACLILSGLLINQLYPGWPNGENHENLRPVIQEMQQRLQPDEGIYVYYGAKPAFQVYFSGPLDNVKMGRWFRSQPLEEKLADIRPFLLLHPRTWLIASHMVSADEVPNILSALDQHCQRLDQIEQTDALAIQYDCALFETQKLNDPKP